MASVIAVGPYRCHPLDGGTLKVDGGAMFGAVPKTIWEKKVSVDAQNRVALSVTPLLIQGPRIRVLVDPGMGARERRRFGKRYGIGKAPTIEDELGRVGTGAAEIDIVVNTHLHWDHSGANVAVRRGGHPRPAFPNAAYVVQAGEWESACKTTELTAEAYLGQTDPSLVRSGRLQLIRGGAEIAPGIRVIPTPGHTPHHQSVLIESGDETLFYPGDLIPTAAHLPLTCISALDLAPEDVFRTRKEILQKARQEKWTLLFCHGTHRKVLRLSRAKIL